MKKNYSPLGMCVYIYYISLIAKLIAKLIFFLHFSLKYLFSHSALEFLLDNNADPSLRDKQGYAAVHYAAAFGNRQNLELVSETATI